MGVETGVVSGYLALGIPGGLCLLAIIVFWLLTNSQNKQHAKNIDKFSGIISNSIDKLCDKMDNFTEKIVENSVINQAIHEDIKEIKEEQKKIVSIVEKIDNNTTKCWVNQNKRQNRN